jgi:uncharacterized membrane protein
MPSIARRHRPRTQRCDCRGLGPGSGAAAGAMEWIPVVTFLQVSADMAVAIDVPDGHGHRYVKEVVNAWAAVLRPPGWTPDNTERLRQAVRAPE